MGYGEGIFKIGPVWPEKSSIPWSCKSSTLSIALLQLSWEIRIKNLIQENPKSWACNFWVSCNSWAACPLSLSMFWAKKKKNLLGFGAFGPKPKENFYFFCPKHA